jgi:hypothetical protein
MSEARRWISGLMVIAALAEGACSRPSEPEASDITVLTESSDPQAGTSAKRGEQRMQRRSDSATPEVLDRIAELAEHRPFGVDHVQRLTGLRLERNEEHVNRHVVVHRSPPEQSSALFASAELRKTPGTGGMVLLGIHGDCVTLERVGERFGPARPGPPPPHGAQADQVEYFLYDQPWGVIRLGFDAAGCLVRAVLKAER